MVMLLRSEELRGLISVEDGINAVAEAYRDLGHNPGLNAARRRIHVEGNRISVHQGSSPSAGVSGALIHCEQLRLHKTHQEYINLPDPVTTLYSIETGDLLAIIVGWLWVGPWDPRQDFVFCPETACTSMAGTRLLARADAAVAGMFGAGREARHHIRALAKVRKLKLVKVYSRTSETRRQFARELEPQIGVEVRPVESPREVVDGSDVILCCTSSNLPVFDGSWLVPGQHVTSIVGSNIELVRSGLIKQARREIDDETLRRADVIVTTLREQAIQDQQGDLYEPSRRGVFNWDSVVDLGELIAGMRAGRTRPDQITLFKQNADQGVGYMALARKLYDRARELGLGMEIPAPPPREYVVLP